MTALRLRVLFVPHDVGGRPDGVVVGLRPGIRWMKFVGDGVRDWDFFVDAVSPLGERLHVVEGRTRSDLSPKYLTAGLGVELLEGPQVIAVGQIA